MAYSTKGSGRGEYGVHKLWFTYSDERNYACSIDDMFPPCLQVFPTFDLAEQHKIQLDTSIVRGGRLDLWGYRGEELFTSPEIKAFLTEKGWLIEDEEYVIGQIPWHAKDADIETFLRLSGMDFHVVIEHHSAEKGHYLQLSPAFWPEDVRTDLLQTGRVSAFDLWDFEDTYTWIHGVFVNDFPINDIAFNREKSAWNKAIGIFLDVIKTHGEAFFFWNEEWKNWSDYPLLFQSFIQTSPLFQINSNGEISSQLRSKLQSMNPRALDTQGKNELKVFINLLKIKAFLPYSRFLTINGQTVKNQHDYDEFHY